MSDMVNGLTAEEWNKLTDEVWRWVSDGFYKRIITVTLSPERGGFIPYINTRNIESVNFYINKIVYLTLMEILDREDFKYMNEERDRAIRICDMLTSGLREYASYEDCDLYDLHCSREMNEWDEEFLELCEKYLRSIGDLD